MITPDNKTVLAYLQGLYREYGEAVPIPPAWAHEAMERTISALTADEALPDIIVTVVRGKRGDEFLQFLNWLRDRSFQLGFILGRDSAGKGWDDSLLADIKEEHIGTTRYRSGRWNTG